MRSPLKRLGMLVALLAAGSTLARTQDVGFDVQAKLRAGYGLASTDDHLAHKTLGFGFDFGYQGSFGRMGLELGYQYKPGDQYLTDVTAMPVAPGASVDPVNSVDSRKNSLAGITLRLSYEKGFAGSSWLYRLGAQFGGSQFRQEYIGDVTDSLTYEDTYNGAVTKSEKSISPFIGAAYAINAFSSIELNLVLLNYTSANYVHVAGTVPGGQGGHTAQDYTTTKKQSVPHLELGYVYHF